ncbi:hypothetical protein [Vibrio splendidus]|uniref:hypothetical protein n=1 Tax=Vibrio splendidus TaxID=29497 RepID=UPI000C857D14|nr:hypothetical protein [Vibrio splendidus]PMP52625.1 hypothetical protein BCS85_04610 [Vibrio splendidus]
MPRKQATYTHRRLTLYVKANIDEKHIDTRVKHQLIATIIFHFKISQREAILTLREATSDLLTLPNQSAFSTYLKKYKEADAPEKKDKYENAVKFLALKKGVNVYDCHLTIEKSCLKEGRPEGESKFASTYLKINDSDVPPWHERNIGFIRAFSAFINNDPNHYKTAIDRIVEAIKNVSFKNEKINFDNSVSWYRKNIYRKLSHPISEWAIHSTPLQAEIFILERPEKEETEVDQKPILFMALKSHDCTGYTPIKLSPNAANELAEVMKIHSNLIYTINVKKQNNIVLIKLVISTKNSTTNQASTSLLALYTKIRYQVVTSKGERQNLHQPFNLDCMDGNFTIQKNKPLNNSVYRLSTNTNSYNHQGIIKTLDSLHHILSELSTSEYQSCLFQAHKVRGKQNAKVVVDKKVLRYLELDTKKRMPSYFLKTTRTIYN